MFDTNLGGTLNTCLPLLPAMLARGGGQIAFMSSLAALSPLPDAAAYSGSKAAILAYGLALRQKLRAGGIRVSVICPGFVATGMGARYNGWRPLELGRRGSDAYRGWPGERPRRDRLSVAALRCGAARHDRSGATAALGHEGVQLLDRPSCQIIGLGRQSRDGFIERFRPGPRGNAVIGRNLGRG